MGCVDFAQMLFQTIPASRIVFNLLPSRDIDPIYRFTDIFTDSEIPSQIEKFPLIFNCSIFQFSGMQPQFYAFLYGTVIVKNITKNKYYAPKISNRFKYPLAFHLCV